VNRPRVSTVLSLYFYYKTGCQVLFVKSVPSCLESAALRIGITSASDVDCPTATSRQSLSGGRGGGPLLKKREKWRTRPEVRSLSYARSFGHTRR
jgi:hypothetical protein